MDSRFKQSWILFLEGFVEDDLEEEQNMFKNLFFFPGTIGRMIFDKVH